MSYLISEAIGVINFTDKGTAQTLQPGLEYDDVKPQFKTGIFKRIF